MKCRNISINPMSPYVSTISRSMGRCGGSNTEAAYMIYRKSIAKFPHYRFYFELENNELYKVTPRDMAL